MALDFEETFDFIEPAYKSTELFCLYEFYKSYSDRSGHTEVKDFKKLYKTGSYILTFGGFERL
jgi:hypothetical protein